MKILINRGCPHFLFVTLSPPASWSCEKSFQKYWFIPNFWQVFCYFFTRSRNRTNRIDFLFVTLRPPASLSCEKNLTKIFGYLTSCKKTCYRVSVWKVYLCSHITSQHNNFEPSLDVKTTKYVLETILILLCILLYCILLVTVLLSQLSI